MITRKLNRNRLAVEKESARAVEVCAVGLHVIILQPLQDLVPRMMIDILSSNRDDGKAGTDNPKKIVAGCARAAMMRDLQYVRLGVLF